MTTTTLDAPIVLKTRSKPMRDRQDAKMSYEDMTKYSGMPEHVIKNYEKNINFYGTNSAQAKLHKEAIDQFLIDHYGKKLVMSIEESEELRMATLEMLVQHLESCSLEQILKAARILKLDVD